MATRLGPATGTVRWLRPWDSRTGTLRITVETARGPVAERYEVEATNPGWLLWAPDPGGSWSRPLKCRKVAVDRRGDWTCTCPDSENRPERRHTCKHVLGLKAAIKALPF